MRMPVDDSGSGQVDVEKEHGSSSGTPSPPLPTVGTSL